MGCPVIRVSGRKMGPLLDQLALALARPLPGRTILTEHKLANNGECSGMLQHYTLRQELYVGFGAL